MPEPIDADPHAAAVMAETLAVQAAALEPVHAHVRGHPLEQGEVAPRCQPRSHRPGPMPHCPPAPARTRRPGARAGKIAKSNEQTIERGQFPA